MNWRKPAFIVAALVTLLLLNGIVWRHEYTLSHGRMVLLPLRPVDPRSLMQGDYMALEYQLTQQVSSVLSFSGIPSDTTEPPRPFIPGEGDTLHAMLKPDANGVAQLVRFGNEALQPRADEIMLRVKWGEDGARLPSHSYFFAEGEGARFAKARFAIFRVASDGSALLAGLADEQRQPIPDRVAEH
ncbi:GDYXXLXY domain-containing protein [Andreprevotia chitinilytica]|uniref:GDYXXLXY domain-containing protein n=1 Tax=Andreprevotia chitinilytica TaxID=396808 RepID=UPI00054F2D84|nr:GDYXXLXY domain-containing protein [Andreprevotia chitinilytica]